MSDYQPDPVTQRIKPPSLVGSPVVLPDLRRRAQSGSAGTPNAQPRTGARTREAQRRAERGNSRPTRSDAASRLPPRLAGNWAAQDAAMMSMSQPHSLAVIWAHQVASADYYDAALLKWPRYAFGCLATAVAAVIYTAVWWLAPLSRAVATAAVIALWIWWPF